jgi:DNA-binding NarL/FixJ family response regulator
MTVARPKVSVLLVDDDTDLLDSLEILVEASEHLDLAGRATNTAHAIGHCRRHQPDVVLADIRMPGADGLSLTRTLTGGSRRGRPRVLVTTAFPSTSTSSPLSAAAPAASWPKEPPGPRLNRHWSLSAKEESPCRRRCPPGSWI